MAAFETLVVKLGPPLAKALAKLWLKEAPLAGAAADGAFDALKGRIGDFETRRATERLFEGIQDEVARRLAPLVEVEFRDLPEGDREAAVGAVAGMLDRATLPARLAEGDLDAARLEAAALDSGGRDALRHLGERPGELARLLLRETCNYVVTLAGKLPDFQVAATRELLRRSRSLLDDLARVLDEVAALRATAERAGDDAARDTELQYRRAVVRRLDRLELFGLRFAGGGARAWGLTVAFVTLTATQQGAGARTGRADEALAGIPRALVRGEAGSGKTTLLQWLAVKAAGQALPPALSPWNGRVPFYVRLRDYADGPLPAADRLMEAAGRNLAGEVPAAWTVRVLRERGLLLLDGIDELPAGRRASFAQWLRELLDDFPDLHVVASSRPAALDGEAGKGVSPALSDMCFADLVLEPMTPTESDALVAQWHAAVARDVADEQERDRLAVYERDLRRALRDRPAIRRLCANPLLCAMVCALNWDRRQRLPDDRMELYRVALEMLLEGREGERGIRPAHLSRFERRDKEKLLDGLAYWMLRNGHSEAPRDEAEEQVAGMLPRLAHVTADAATVLQELLERSGVLRQPQHGLVDFVHRTFLEYMAARQAVALNDLGLLAERARDGGWREAVVFAAGHTGQHWRDRFVEMLLRRSLFGKRPVEADVTAVCCLETVAGNLRPDLLRQLHEAAQRLFPPRNTAMAAVLAPAAARMDPAILEGHGTAGAGTVAACIRLAATIGGERMLRVVAGYAGVEGSAVEEELARAWDAFDERAFLEQVVQRRPRLFGLDTAEIDAEGTAWLCLMFQLGLQRDVEDLHEQWARFKSEHVLRIREARGALRSGSSLLDRVKTAIVGGVQTDGSAALSERTISANGGARHLAKLTSLRELDLSYDCSIEGTALASVGSLSSLRVARLEVAGPCDLNMLNRLPELVELSLSGKDIADIRPLAGLAGLRSLSLHSWGDGGAPDLTPLAGLAGLQELSLYWRGDGGAPDLTPLAGFAGLRSLRLSGTGATDLTPLAGLAGITLYHSTSQSRLRLPPSAGSWRLVAPE